ncbi:MAG: hypothetical protein RML48_04880 [Candidatus Bipolaricaulota bacterium]|nr:hypothetical protein [Candidatus Bipolaricaulota bacterium]
MANDLRELLRELEARPLIAEERRRRLPKPASRFIRRKVEACKAKGRRVMVCVTNAYQLAKRRGLL